MTTRLKFTLVRLDFKKADNTGLIAIGLLISI